MNKEATIKEYIEKMLREYEIKNNCLEHKENFCIEIFNNIISEEKVIGILKNYGYVFLKKHKGFEINLGYLRENKYFKRYFHDFFKEKSDSTIIKYSIYEFLSKGSED